MNSTGGLRPSRPQSVKELVAQAENFHFNTNIGLKHWNRAAETLYQEASFALSEGDYGRAYTMLYRHSTLVLKHIPSHPQFKDPENRKAFKILSKRVDSVLKDLESLKPEIESVYAEWERTRPAQKPVVETPAFTPGSYGDHASRDPSLGGYTQVLDASEHQDLAVDLAQQELRRRDTARRATVQAGIPDQETSVRRRAGLWDSVGPGFSRQQDDFDLQRQLEATRRTLDQPSYVSDSSNRRETQWPTTSNYNYPSIAKSRHVDDGGWRENERDSLADRLPPPLPVKAPLAPSLDMPARPPKQPFISDLPPVPKKSPLAIDDDARGPSEAPPALPRKERLTFRPGAYLENGEPIRSVFLPTNLRHEFLKLAEKNTRAGLEMCGILCGMPVNNALFVRCLLIPDQKCTSDTCETQNESAMFDYCDKEDLLMIGWIHTHPTQTCFMSSRDLHTHAGYQIMMPESIAIVCAPKFEPSYGIFRLTRPPGLEHILQCTHTDTFHQHSISNLYRGAERPDGHVYESEKLPFYVHDLRSQ
ncbi:JAB1/Mov34/MPN/PAD-1 ubiquitin protease domain-containing protein [Sarocladium implicatum]|nr:JAB1/Mov34/MPN/PAD-1 ubiquitin protease domain-containing protein [Sarocladium implicatum]